MPAPVITKQMFRTQKITIFAEPMLNGLEAPLQAIPTWSIDLPLLATLIPSTDGLSCQVVATGTVGTVLVTFDALGQTAIQQVVQVNIVTDFANTVLLSTSQSIPQ